jgi:hypothetical protein
VVGKGVIRTNGLAVVEMATERYGPNWRGHRCLALTLRRDKFIENP